MKKCLFFVVIVLCSSLNSYSQGLPNKFTNPLSKDTTITLDSLKMVLIDGSKVEINKSITLPTINLIGNQTMQSDSSYKVVYSSETKLPIYIEFNQQRQMIKSQSIDTIRKNKTFSEVNALSYNYLDEIKSITNLSSDRSNLEILDTKIDENGKSHIKFQQKLNGIKIYGSQFLIHLNQSGQGELFNGSYTNITESIETTPKITKDLALNIVKSDLSRKTILKEFNKYELGLLGGVNYKIDTFIYKIANTNVYVLAYMIIFKPNLHQRYEYTINAINGEIIKSLDLTCNVDVSKTTQAVDLNGVNRNLNSVYDGQQYLLADITKPMYSSSAQTGLIITFDAGNIYNKLNIISNNNNLWTPLQVSAHANIGAVYDFYKNVHNRNSIDGKGGTLYSLINVVDVDGSKWPNASWDGAFMNFGNGDAATKPWAGALDIAGHEMTHGIIDNTAGLKYEDQSGAINESFADIFGSMIDSTNWTIGESIVVKSYYPSGAMRSFADPHNGATKLNPKDNTNHWQPRHISEFVTGSILDNYQYQDHGGVHINSGIPNYAFYLYANSIGRLKASRVYYRALTTYLLPTDDFTKLRLAIIKSASDLYSTNEVIQAGFAFDAVGVSDGNTQTIVKQLLPNPGGEYMLLYGTGDTTIYIGTSNLKGLWAKKINNKPSITDDGKTAYFVGGDKKIYSLTVDPSLTQPTYTIVDSRAIWNNVAISKDGRRLAASTASQDSSIYVYDFGKKNWFRFKLYNPTYTLGANSAGPIYADSFEWDYASENIIYDCYNKKSSSNGLNDIKYWDINLINVWNKTKDTTANGFVSKLFKLSENQNVGNPSFSKNSPDVFAFDFFNDSLKIYAVYGYNIQTNKISANPIVTSNTLGFPTYNKNDDKIAFNKIVSNKLTISSISLNPDKLSSIGSSSVIYNNATYPVYYSVGSRKFAVPSKPQITTNRSPNLCTGDSVILTSSATIGNQWYKNGILIPSANKQIYTTNLNGNYSVLSNVDSISSSLSSSLYVTMNPIPSTPIIGRDTSGNLISTKNYGNLWYRDGTLTSDTTNKIKPVTNGLYTNKTLLNGCFSLVSNSYYFLITDIVNLSSTEYIKLNPNPFYSNLNLEFKVNTHQQLNIDVFSLSSGQKVVTRNNQYSGSLLNLGQLTSGVYIFIVYSNDNKIKAQFKMIKL